MPADRARRRVGVRLLLLRGAHRASGRSTARTSPQTLAAVLEGHARLERAAARSAAQPRRAPAPLSREEPPRAACRARAILRVELPGEPRSHPPGSAPAEARRAKSAIARHCGDRRAGFAPRIDGRSSSARRSSRLGYFLRRPERDAAPSAGPTRAGRRCPTAVEIPYGGYAPLAISPDGRRIAYRRRRRARIDAIYLQDLDSRRRRSSAVAGTSERRLRSSRRTERCLGFLRGRHRRVVSLSGGAAAVLVAGGLLAHRRQTRPGARWRDLLRRCDGRHLPHRRRGGEPAGVR